MIFPISTDFQILSKEATHFRSPLNWRLQSRPQGFPNNLWDWPLWECHGDSSLWWGTDDSQGVVMCSRQRAWQIASLMSTSSYEANEEEGRELWVWNSPPAASLHHFWPPGCLVLQMWSCYASNPFLQGLLTITDASEGGCPALQGLLLGYRIIALPSCFWEGGFPRLLARAEQGWLDVLAAKQLTCARGVISLGILVSLCPDDSTREGKISVGAELWLRNQETCLWHLFQDSGETVPFWDLIFPICKVGEWPERNPSRQIL